MPTRSLNKNGTSYEDYTYGEWDLPEFMTYGDMSQINSNAVKSPDISQSLAAINKVTNGNGGTVTSPARAGYETGGPGDTTLSGDVILQKAATGEPITLPIISAVKNVADTTVTKPDTKTVTKPDKWSTAVDMGLITADQVYDAQGNFLSAGMTISPGGPGSSDRAARERQIELEYKYLLQEAPSWFFDSLGNRKSETMSQGRDPEKTLAKNESPVTKEEAAEYVEYRAQVEREDIWLKNAREVDKPGYVPRKVDEPRISELLTTDEDDSTGVEKVESGLHEASIAEVVGTDESGKEIVEVAGRTYRASEDDWTRDEFQSAWTEVQKGGGVPSWAIRTVRVPEWGIDPDNPDGSLIQTMRSEISPQTQLLLEENARLAGIRQTSESQRLGQYAAILQNPRAAAAMRIMEQMGLGGIAQLLGTPQAQAAQPFQSGSGPYIGSDTPEITGGIPSTAMAQAPMTPEQLRLQEMWGGGMIPTTGFLSGADPDRRAISQVLQQIAGFSPEQTFRSSVGVTPGVSPGYQIPRLLAMRR